MMGQAARVFVGVPTLNRPGYVRETVLSVMAQTFGDFRLVVSDNGSDPEVCASVKGWIEGLDDQRVSFHQQPENRGEIGQGWYFFRQAKEKYFVMLHDDDVLKPGYLAHAVATLEARPHLAFFTADPFVMDERSERLAERTTRYLAEHGRAGRPEGEFDVRDNFLEAGYSWLSGTCFRFSTLQASGFVDEDCDRGHYLELAVFVRVAELGTRAWYRPEELLGHRFHGESLRTYCGWHPEVVATATKLLERRRFRGQPERRRRACLSFLHRVAATQRLHEGDVRGFRAALRRAILLNPLSPRNWSTAVLGLAAPDRLRARLNLPEARFSPEGAGARAAVGRPEKAVPVTGRRYPA